MIQDIMPGTEEKLMEGPQAAYVGIDPTADSLHIGHLVSVMILKHFQNCGHKPYALVGGATGMIGDPSMKSQERNLLDEETLAHNVAGIKVHFEFHNTLAAAVPTLFMGGINPTASDYTLAGKKSLVTPTMIFTYTNDGKGGVTRNLHRWARKYQLLDGTKEREVLLNSWEGVHP